MSILDLVKSTLSSSDSQYGRLAGMAIDILQNNPHGGVEGLLQAFMQSGLGDEVKSWISTGGNLPIDGADITKVLGAEKLREIAQHAGVSTDAAAGGLADILPKIVDKLSPGGAMPNADQLAQMLSQLRGLAR